ncbi:MAG: phosphatase PAP2 family protein [Bacteroidota bacterium]|nr:phosphatase PAP2 family protein [Bacteroidota bacterium]MDP4190477.1 phosphatase PAP2 family protein [Bacteroidota bacterium]MDP4196417.1 phosphatase PAP2 family protein [Bacteroidota bacterium]
MRKILTVLMLSIAVSAVQSQEFSQRLKLTANNISQAISENLRWYDLPVGAMYISGKYLAPESDDRIKLGLSNVDLHIQKELGFAGKTKPDNLNRDIIPQSILLTRVLYNAAYDLFSKNTDGIENHRHSFLFYKSLVYTYTLTEFVKNWTYRQRPDSSDTKSFFSGHSSTSFAAASFLFLEFNDYLNEKMPERTLPKFAAKFVSFSILYGWASFVAYSRLKDNKHYLSDVLIGALAGTAISNIVYYSYITNKNKALSINLGMVNNSPSLSFLISF